MATDIYKVTVEGRSFLAAREQDGKGRPKTVVFADRPATRADISAVRIAVDKRKPRQTVRT